MSERKLAHIERVVNIEPIPEADKIEKVTVLGWEVVVKKEDGIKIGDLVCYIEIDSIVPPIPEFEFLEHRRYRIRTIKLRKQVSQGLIIRLDKDVLPDGTCKYYLPHSYRMDYGFPSLVKEGDDVTKYFGIVKYDPQAKIESVLVENKKSNPVHKFLLRFSWYRKIQPKKKGKWPEWITKTDEERIQNIPSVLRKFAETSVYWTEKLDGQSASYSLKKVAYSSLFSRILVRKLFTVCSRNIWLKRPSNQSYWEIVRKYDLENKLKGYNKEIIIQGEIIGPGIQKNKYQLKEIDFYVFSIYDISSNIRMGLRETEEICKQLGLKMVPVLGSDVKLNTLGTVQDLVKLSIGKSVLFKRQREGIVVRNQRFNDEQLSFKVISPDFLLGLSEDE